MPDFTTSDGIRLHYEDDGSGLPVLCLPGLTRNGRDFDYLAPHLDGVRLLRLDARGRGQSQWADPATYDLSIETRDVVELLDHLGLERTAIIGTSRGGLAAMVLAAAAPGRLSGVCLVDIGPALEQRGLEAIRGYIGKPPTATTLEEAARLRASLFPDFENVPLTRWREEAERHYIPTSKGLKINYDSRLADVFNAALEQPMPDLWPLFDALDGRPIALVRGANSNLLSTETTAEMRRHRPDMIFADVPGRGHVPFLDEPEALAVIRRWLEPLR